MCKWGGQFDLQFYHSALLEIAFTLLIIIIIITLGQAWLAVLHLLDQDGNQKVQSNTEEVGARTWHLRAKTWPLGAKTWPISYRLSGMVSGMRLGLVLCPAAPIDLIKCVDWAQSTN